MRNLITGFLLCYTILLSCFAYGQAQGQVATVHQACVEHATYQEVRR